MSGLESTTTGLWESVLRRSMQSGDVQRIQAALDLARSGGVCSHALSEAREELHRLAKAELCDAAQKCDLDRLAAAIDSADEVGLPTAKLHEARSELRELASTELKRVLELADADKLDGTIAHIVKLGAAEPVCLENAQKCLRQLRGQDVVTRATSPEQCIIDIRASVDDVDGGSPVEEKDAGWSQEKDQGSHDFQMLEAFSRRKTSVLGCSKPSLVAPMVIGRPLANIDLLEAGLSTDGVIDPHHCKRVDNGPRGNS